MRAATADTFIVDVDVDEPALVGEVSLMQVRADSDEWHRRAINQDMTACGKPLDPKFNMGIRYESYEGRLCKRGCFTSYELALSDEANKPPNP